MTLVRLWRGLTEQLPSAFVDWDDDDRAFTINRDNPMAIELWEGVDFARFDTFVNDEKPGWTTLTNRSRP